MKTTDLPSRILEAMKYTTKTNSYTVELLAVLMGVSAKTLRGHMAALVKQGALVREHRYKGAVGAYYYFVPREPSAPARKSRTPANRK